MESCERVTGASWFAVVRLPRPVPPRDVGRLLSPDAVLLIIVSPWSAFFRALTKSHETKGFLSSLLGEST